MNTYAYVGGNPVSNIDPTGTIAFAIPLIPFIITGVDLAIGAGLGVGAYALDKVYDFVVESRSRGERGVTGGTSGQNTGNPYKHCRDAGPNHIECRDHQTGKWVRKPKPFDWDKRNCK